MSESGTKDDSSLRHGEAARRRLLELRRLQRAGAGEGAVIRARPASSRAALSFSQRGLWFLERLDGSSNAYNIARAVRVRGLLDVRLLEQCVREVVARHESLRTSIAEHDGVAEQCVHAADDLVKRIVLVAEPVDGNDEKGCESTLARLLREAVAEPFDLSKAPLLRARLFQLEDDEYVLLLVVHHIVSDGWSMGVLLRELSALYASNGDAGSLPTLPIQFADFAIWQQQQLITNRAEEQLRYWRGKLSGLVPLELPTDRPRPPRASHRGDLRRFDVPNSTVVALKKLGQAENATLFMVVFAAFQVLLMRYSGQTDVAVAVPVAGRERAETERLIGYFVNMLVLRTDLSGDPTFLEALARVRATALEGYANQALPFDRLVAELMTQQRDLSRNPLYQVSFVLQNLPAAALELKGLQTDAIELQKSSARVDLTLGLREVAGALRGEIEYASDLFNGDTIERMGRHFCALLEGIAANPAIRIESLQLLDAGERRQLLIEWNDTIAPYATERCVHQLFEMQALRTPEQVALEFRGRRITYRELDARVTGLASRLNRLGVARGALVGVHLGRSPLLVIAVLGVMKAGAAYVPLDPAYPAERLRYMARNAGLSVLLTSSTETNAASWADDSILQLDVEQEADDGSNTPNANSDVQRAAVAEDPAYVIYTSGSTGRPKGVVVPHRAIVNFLQSMAREPGMTSTDRLLAVTTLSFDIAVLELMLPLMVGATIVLASQEEVVDGWALRNLLERGAATVMQATPATWRLLIEARWRGSPEFKVLVGGETLQQDLARALLDRAGSVWNMYGPTETTVWSTCCRIEALDREGISIGRPIANTRVYVLDKNREPSPIGVSGEIFIGGDGVALGYLQRPDLTVERFVDDPFRPGHRLYRTGDRGCWRADGRLEHQGRLDFQVKLRGHRIELGEIESSLSSCPGVTRAVAAVHESRPGEGELVVYVVPAGPMPALSDLRDHLRALLPGYMLPQHYVELDAIPLLPNGKVDRRALPAPARCQSGEERGVVKPRSDAERAIAQVWAELLGIEHVSVTDNFFDLGGYSLLALRAINEIEKRLGVRLEVRRLVMETLAQLASSATGDRTDAASEKTRPSRLLAWWRAR